MKKRFKTTVRSLILSAAAVLIGATTSFASAPATPTLHSPASGSNVGGNPLIFKWILDPNAAYYFLYIAKDQNFSQMVVDTGAFLNPGGTYGTYNLATQDIGQIYYWKMAAMNVYGYSPFSAIWYVINGPSTAPPSTPTLWYPGNGVDINDTAFALMWYSDRATDYYLQVATTPQFTNSTIVFGKWIGNNPTYYIGGLLNYGETYYWRVKAKNSYGESTYSSYQSFRYYDSLTCTSTYGSGIGVTNNTQGHIDACNANGGYYLYDISRRAGQTGHSHAGGMNSAAAIKTKHFFGFIYDADNVWSNNSSYELRPLVDGHVYAAWVYDYLYTNNIKNWSLNSYDGGGSSMVSTAEKPCYDTNKTTAKWDGAKVIYYASCDGASKSYAGALDLVADAWGDAVTEKACGGLDLQYESGALRVAFSDWLAATVENYYDPGNWNWTIGEDILNIQRDLSNPKSYSHPDTYKGLYYYDTTYCTPTISNDYCYVHTNSGVPNKMFYLLSQGGTLNGVTVQGIGVTDAMKLAYLSNKNHWSADTTFYKALEGMVYAADYYYPLEPNIATQIKNAWAAVGVKLNITISTSVSPEAGGSLSGPITVPYGDSTTFTVNPNDGYHISSVTGCDGTLNGNTYTTGAITADCIVTASFAINTYTVTPSSGANGTISPSTPKTVNYNGTTSFTLAPNTGYHIASVTGCGGTLSGNTFTTGGITDNCTVTATFSNTYALTVSKSGIGNGTISSSPVGISCGGDCTENYIVGTTPTISVTPDAGSTFTGWSGGGCSGTGNCTVTMSADTTVTATFGCANTPVRILGKADYSTLQAAYNAAADGDTIQSQAVTLNENVNANRNISVTIDGGYNCYYSSNPGSTALKGSLTTNSGTVNIKNFNLQF